MTVAVVVSLSGCGYSGSHAEQVRQWVAQNTYVVNEQQVVADARSVELAAEKGTPLQLRTVCGGLSSDAGTLYSTLDTPDHTLTEEIAVSMEDFFNGAEPCSVASSTTSPATKGALAKVRAGLAALAVANRRMAGFGVRGSSLYQG